MPDRTWITVSFSTPLIFRYHLPLNWFFFTRRSCCVPWSFACLVNKATIAKFGLVLLVETGKIEKLWAVISSYLFEQDPSVNTSIRILALNVSNNTTEIVFVKLTGWFYETPVTVIGCYPSNNILFLKFLRLMTL